jgi:hypothetical protein
MSDDIDLANDRAMVEAERALRTVRQAASAVMVGVPGNCDLCGEHSMRLIGGACAPCRDRYKLP